MSQVIVYLQDNGMPAIVIPTPDALARWGIQAIAIKDVPAGKRFAIMNASDVPQIPLEEWQVSETVLTSGVGGSTNEFPAEEKA